MAELRIKPAIFRRVRYDKHFRSFQYIVQFKEKIPTVKPFVQFLQIMYGWIMAESKMVESKMAQSMMPESKLAKYKMAESNMAESK